MTAPARPEKKNVEAKTVNNNDNNNSQQTSENHHPANAPAPTAAVPRIVPETTKPTASSTASSAKSSPEPNIGVVVSKAKRAAQSLWILIHAQNCRVGGECPHAGCVEAKRVLLHLKTCRAPPGTSCPTPGCDASRKLLAHHQRCREIRAKRAGSRDKHVCLVCSYLARHARTALEGKKRVIASFTLQRSMAPPPPRPKPEHMAAANALHSMKRTDVARRLRSESYDETKRTNQDTIGYRRGRSASLGVLASCCEDQEGIFEQHTS